MGKPAKIEAIYELSPQQEGMLFESLRDAGGDLFIEQTVHAMPGTLDCDVFRQAWSYLLRRHAILRTAFAWKSRVQPLQVVFYDLEPPIALEDWRDLPVYRRHRRLEDHLEADRKQGFDLSVAPLLRLALLRVSEEAYQLVWTQHHILFDGWSRAILMQEFTAAYRAFENGTPPSQELPPSYGRYIEWLKQQDVSAAERFWRSKLRGFTRPTALGKPSRFAPAPRERFGEIDLDLPAADVARLTHTLRQRRVTLAAALHGAWALLLSRYSGERDVVFGTTVSGRPTDLQGAESIIGLFINTVPLRTAVDPPASVWSWLEDVQALLLEVRSFEFCSAGQIHQWSELPGSLPLYQSILVFENYPMQAGSVRGDTRDQGRYIGARTTYPVTLLASAQDGLILRAVHDARFLDRFAASRILDHLRLVLTWLASGRDGSLEELQRLIPDSAVPQVRTAPVHKGAAYVAPVTPLEKKLIAIAEEVLGRREISMTDRFFALGGHSLLATQLASRVHRVFHIEVPLRVLFESPNMKALAVFIEEALLARLESLSEEEARMLMEQVG